MADETGRSPVSARQAPDFLTVSQTALVLQLGRSTTYMLVGRFVETGGVEGIPAVLVGGQYRVLRARLEEMTGGPLTWPPAPRQRAPRRRPTTAEAVHNTDRAGEPQPALEAAEDAVETLVRDLRSSSPLEQPEPPTPMDSVGDVDHAYADDGKAQVESNPPTDAHRSSSVVWSQSSLPFAR